jgi:hypothetical protein
MVDDWFRNFTARLEDRIPRVDWPEHDSEFWSTLRKALLISGASEDIADEASERLAMDGANYLDSVIPELKKHIGNICRERHRAGSGSPVDSRESAEADSRSCHDCGGNGITSRYRHNPEAVSSSVSCYCLCSLGRWIERNHRAKSPDVHRRMIDLDRSAFLRLGPVSWSDSPDSKFRHRPEHWDRTANRPKPSPSFRAIVDNRAASLRGLTLDANGRDPAKASRSGVPAGLTPSQEMFLFTIGDHWRSCLRSLPTSTQAEILSDVAESFDNARLVSATRRIVEST